MSTTHIVYHRYYQLSLVSSLFILFFRCISYFHHRHHHYLHFFCLVCIFVHTVVHGLFHGCFLWSYFFVTLFSFCFFTHDFTQNPPVRIKLLGKTFQGNAKDYRPVSFAFKQIRALWSVCVLWSFRLFFGFQYFQCLRFCFLILFF